MVQTSSRVKWWSSYCGRSEFHCLAVVLFSAMLLCFLLGSFELQEIVCLTKHGATLSSLNISRYDDFSLMLKTEESISEIDSHHILQDASEL